MIVYDNLYDMIYELNVNSFYRLPSVGTINLSDPFTFSCRFTTFLYTLCSHVECQTGDDCPTEYFCADSKSSIETVKICLQCAHLCTHDDEAHISESCKHLCPGKLVHINKQ